MTPEDKVTSLIVKLNRLTSLGQIKWEVMDAPRTILRGTDDHIPLFMFTAYKGQRFGLYQHRYQSYDGDHDRFYWTERLVLAILDSEGRALWETPGHSSALFDLFETVRKKVSNIEGVLDDLLSDDDEL
jgi:hypothetical protein